MTTHSYAQAYGYKLDTLSHDAVYDLPEGNEDRKKIQDSEYDRSKDCGIREYNKIRQRTIDKADITSKADITGGGLPITVFNYGEPRLEGRRRRCQRGADHPGRGAGYNYEAGINATRNVLPSTLWSRSWFWPHRQILHVNPSQTYPRFLAGPKRLTLDYPRDNTAPKSQ